MDNKELKTRRIAWEIIKRASYRNRRLSDVTAEMFRKEGNLLDNKDRRFITMLVQGTVRLSGRLDWEIRQVFVGKFEDLKESLRILLRLGAYQLFYMDNVPDYLDSDPFSSRGAIVDLNGVEFDTDNGYSYTSNSIDARAKTRC